MTSIAEWECLLSFAGTWFLEDQDITLGTAKLWFSCGRPRLVASSGGNNRYSQEICVKTISIVTPCYNEESGIAECVQTVRELFREHLPDYKREHIFCDNASTDRTVEILKELAATDHSIKIIVNSRNFGNLKNTFNGVLNASGDAVLLFLPADLQDPPELIPEFVKQWEAGYEVVYGLRERREEPRLSRWARKAYYRVLSRFS